MDQIAMVIGYFVMIFLFMSLVFGLLCFVGLLITEAWIRFTENYRGICKDESLIHEYKVNRENYLEWRYEEWKRGQKNGN